MKTSAVAIIIDKEYFKLKEQYIMENYEITNFFSLNLNITGESFHGRTILPISDVIKLTDIQTVVIAFPVSRASKEVNLLLFEMGIKAENIVLLTDKPPYLEHEDICTALKGVKYSISSTGDIVCKICNRSIIISYQSELEILKEIYVIRCYDIAHPYKSCVVLDIGMNIGVSSLFFSGLEEVSMVYSFEPFTNTYQLAVRNLELNNALDKVVPLQLGLGNSSREMELNYLEDAKSGMGFFTNPLFDPGLKYQKVMVEIVDAADVFNEILKKHPNEKIIFKMDCEGAEYEVLERLNETNMLKDICAIIMEWHNMGGHNVVEIERILRKNNFIYHVDGWRGNLVGTLFAVNANIPTDFSNIR